MIAYKIPPRCCYQRDRFATAAPIITHLAIATAHQGAHKGHVVHVGDAIVFGGVQHLCMLASWLCLPCEA